MVTCKIKCSQIVVSLKNIHNTSWSAPHSHMPPPNLPISCTKIRLVMARWITLLIMNDSGCRYGRTKVLLGQKCLPQYLGVKCDSKSWDLEYSFQIMAEYVLSTQHAKYQSDVNILLILINNAHPFLLLSHGNETMDNLGWCTRWNNYHVLKGERFMKLWGMRNPLFKVERGGKCTHVCYIHNFRQISLKKNQLAALRCSF